MRGISGVIGAFMIITVACTPSHPLMPLALRDASGHGAEVSAPEDSGAIASEGGIDAGGPDGVIDVIELDVPTGDVGGAQDGPMIGDGPLARDLTPVIDAQDGAADRSVPNDGPSLDGPTPPRDVGNREAADSAAQDASTCYFPNLCSDCAWYECNGCVPAGAPETTSMVLSSTSWPGFKFQVTQAGTVKQIGFYVIQDAGSVGTAFAAIVALTDASDQPNSIDLSTSDVLGTGLIPLPPSGVPAVVATTTPSIQLAPGWYAAVFGLGKFGATATGALLPFQNGNNICLNGQASFTLRQNPQSYVSNVATPHVFVEIQ
jgi:hypothetical protein